RVSSSGSPGGEINIQSTTVDDTSPSVALKRGRRFVVAYDTSSKVRVTEASATDTVIDTVDARPPRPNPAVRIDASRRCTLTYTSLAPQGPPPPGGAGNSGGGSGSLFWLHIPDPGTVQSAPALSTDGLHRPMRT